MAAGLWRRLVFATLLALSTGQTISPANFTDSTGDLEGDNAIKVEISQGDDMVPLSAVLALSDAAKNELPPPGLSGPVFLADTSNQLDLRSDQIAVISCDSSSGFLGALDVLDSAAEKDVNAVLFYTEFADYCDLQEYSDGYQWIYSMKSLNDTKQMLQAVQSSDNGDVYATIGYPDAINVINGTGGDDDGGTSQAAANGSDGQNNGENNNPLGAPSTTAVAMIILYSITGLITALFLVIIITGAFRAHRHPERYGPRNPRDGGSGRSRAKGLARAFLDTLPIVKFGEREEPKPADVELSNNPQNTTSEGGRNASESSGQEANDVNATETDVQTDRARHSIEGGIAGATENNQTSDPNNLGCSICTEDFEAGQDQRVLPCDHRFHPDCVDPWLLNVSGTCPLCRVDLRPETARTSSGDELDENGNPIPRESQLEPPPLGPQATEWERRRMRIRRSIALGIMDIGRPDRMTREERVLALRRLRGQQLARQRREEQASAAETPEEETRTRRRLRDVLGIRTRRAEPRSEQVQSETEAAGEREGSEA